MADMTTKILTVELNADSAINGIINLNNAIEQNTADMKANSKQIAENNKMMKDGKGDVMQLTAQNQKLAQANVELEAKTKALKDEKRILQKETQNEIKMQTEEEGSLRSLKAELSKATAEFERLKRAKRETGARGVELKTKINALTNEIKAAEYETQRYYRNVGNYQSAILSAIGLNGMWGQSIMNITNITATSSTSISQSFSTIGTSAKALGKSLMALLTNPVFLAIAGIAGVGMAFKWWYDYNSGLAEATRLTREFFDVTGEGLQHLRDGIRATADTYGKDFKDVLEAVDTISSHWGISAQEALDTLNKGFAAGGDLSGDMLDKLERYAPALRDAGYNAKETVALIAQTRQGLFSEQGLEAIRQAGVRLRSMSESTKTALRGIGIDADDMAKKLSSKQMEMSDAIKMVADGLKKVGDNSQEAGDVMADVFGKAGKFASQDMLELLGDIETNLDIVKQKTGEWGEDMDTLRQKDEELKEAISELFDVTGKGFEHSKTSAEIFVKDGLVRVVNWVQRGVTWFKNLWNSSKLVRAGFAYLVNVIHAVWMVATNAWRAILLGIKTVGDAVVALSKTFNAIKKNIAQAFNGLADIFYGIAKANPDKIAEGWRKASQGAAAAVTNFAAGVKDTFSSIGSNVKGTLIDIKDQMVDTFNWSMDAMEYRFDMGGGWGGAESSWGGGSPDRDPDPNRNPSGGSGSGGSGGGSGSSADDQANKLKAATEQLLNQAKQLEQKAMQEMAKVSEEGINQYYDMLERQLREKYAILGEKLNDMATAEGQAFAKLLEANEKARKKALIDLRTSQANQLLQNQIDAERDAKKRFDLQMQQLDNQQKAELEKVGDNEELKNSIIAKYAQKRKEMTDNFAKQQLDSQQKFIQEQIEGMKDDEESRMMRYKLQSELLALQRQQELALYEDNEEMKSAIQEKYLRQQEALDKEYAEKSIEIQQQKYEAIAAVTGGLGQLMGEFADDSKAAAVASKVLALGEIMVSQAVAIANAVRAGSNATNPWQMIAQIAASVTAVTVAMVQAFKSLNQAKFATGGYVRGAGTGTSDSIPVRVSNGESIMNANTTAMFGGLLSSLNQLGGGVPIQVQQTATSVQGEDMLARAFARGVAMLPNPVVSVEDINKGQRQVEVMNERATL